MGVRACRTGRGRRAMSTIVAFLVPTILVATTAEAFIGRKNALERPDVRVVTGEWTERWRVCPSNETTYDIRGLSSVGSFGDISNLSVGNGCAAARVVTVGGSVLGTIDHSLTWGQVKAQYDAHGFRFEGKHWLASFGVSIENVGDGFGPRLADDQRGTDVAFLLSGAYMDWIRDDAIEDDDLMSGVIRNVLIDGTNRFLSADPGESSSLTNPGMTVKIRDVLVHMKAMPNERDDEDGVGFGGIFKWADGAGIVTMSNAIFLLDEPPISNEPFPPGRYSHVKLVLDYRGGYPGNLPDGVRTTHRLRVWTEARSAWLRGHAARLRAAAIL